METIILIVSIGIMNILCFFIGAKVGQKVIKDEPIKLPKIDPFATIKRHNDNKENIKLQERDRIISENIDNYNGTSLGQQDVPR